MGRDLSSEDLQETLDSIASGRRYIEDNLIGHPDFFDEITSRVSDLANYFQSLPDLNDSASRQTIAQSALRYIQWQSELKEMPIYLSNAFAAVVAVGRSVDLSEPDGVREVYRALLQAIDINREFREKDPVIRQKLEAELARLRKEWG